MKRTNPLACTRRRLAMTIRATSRSVVLAALAGCAGSLLGAVKPLGGATFNPALVPTANPAETFNNDTRNRIIVENATLTGVEIDRVLYSDVEGPTNATVTATGETTVYVPFRDTSIPSHAQSVTGLTLAGLFNFSGVKVMFAGTVTTATDGGFFATEWGSSDDVTVYPLDGNGQRIGTWQLHLVDADFGTGDLLRPHGLRLAVKSSTGAAKPANEDMVGGAAFTLADFTGGSGVLDNVRGLEFSDPTPSFDLVVAGIYRGPGESVIYRAGRALRMRNATFDQPLVNPMTNDFSLTGFDGAASIAAPASVYQFDTLPAGNVMWPSNGVQPTLTNALLGLDINGVNNLVHWDLMFAAPVTNAADGFFLVDDTTEYVWDQAFVYPLDADRRPISTYAVAMLPNRYQWKTPALMGERKVKWRGATDAFDKSGYLGGVIMPLSAFAGGTGGLTEVHGIRIYSFGIKWQPTWMIDPLVVGSYTARPVARPIYDYEGAPMPTPTPSADRLSGTIRHDWSLASITLESGRYTDLEGPASVVPVTTAFWWPYDGTVPANAADAALGLDASGLVNAENSLWYFSTPVANGFDGGFFVFEAGVEAGGDDSFRFEPLGVDSNVIAGYTVVLDKTRQLMEKPESFAGLSWTYKASTTGTQEHPRHLYGAAFTLNCFTNGFGQPLTNTVRGLKLKYVDGNADPIMVGLYKGPAAPKPLPGRSLPITAATFVPTPVTSPCSNDAAVVSARSAESASWRVTGPRDVFVYRHQNSQVFFPVNGTNPDPNPGAPYPEGYTNALAGLAVDGAAGIYVSDYLFGRPVRRPDDGFFLIEVNGDDFVRVRPLDANRAPISTYSVCVENDMMGTAGLWTLNSAGSYSTAGMRGTLIRLSDFAGGTGELSAVYGLRVEDLGGDVDPAVVGQWFGPPDGTLISVH